MGDIFDTQTKQWVPDGRHLVRQQDFWYVMGMTTWIVLPWICTREVPVDIELLTPFTSYWMHELSVNFLNLTDDQVSRTATHIPSHY